MHPKRLLDICIDVFVQHTRDIQMSGMSDKEKFLSVKRLWDELWKQPQNIAVDAGELLHSYLMQQTEQDFSLSFFIALAANLRRIIVYHWSDYKLKLRQVSTYDECYFQNNEYHQQELDISGINGEDELNTSVLEEIIPKCLSLKVLKLGFHVNKTLLLLTKRHCPLTVLEVISDTQIARTFNKDSLTENELTDDDDDDDGDVISKLSSMLLSISSVPLDFWMDLFFGVSNVHPTEIVEGIKNGRTPCLQPAWPNLTELNMGCFVLPDDFFVLTRIIYKKLTYTFGSMTPSRFCLTKYMHLKREVPELNSINIGLYIHGSSYEIETKEILHVASTIDYFGLISSYQDENICKDLQKLSEASLYPRIIRLDSPIIKRGTFMQLGKQAKKLLIEGTSRSRGNRHFEKVDIMDLEEFLLDFPALEQLAISFYGGLKCDNKKFLAKVCFTQITSLIIDTYIDQDACNALFQLFPNLHEIMFLAGRDGWEPMHINFQMLPELCVLKIADWNWTYLSNILDIPRDTHKSHRYELHGPSHTLSSQDARKIVNSGWNYFPKSWSILKQECKFRHDEWDERC